VFRWIVVALLVSGTVATQAGVLQGRVVAIADGDTLTVLDSTNVQHRIRLAGIDAPEKIQPFGDASKRSLSDLAHNKDVTVDWNKTDRFGRMVGKVLVGDLDINLEQVKRGLAWWYRYYASEQSPSDRTAYESAEMEAKQSRIGLWAARNPIPPWDWRRRK
jgi:endonuclease YncB( thermonuclease family)